MPFLGGEMTLTTVSMLVCIRANTHLEDKGADLLKICTWKNKRKRLNALISDKADEGCNRHTGKCGGFKIGYAWAE